MQLNTIQPTPIAKNLNNPRNKANQYNPQKKQNPQKSRQPTKPRNERMCTLSDLMKTLKLFVEFKLEYCRRRQSISERKSTQVQLQFFALKD